MSTRPRSRHAHDHAEDEKAKVAVVGATGQVGRLLVAALSRGAAKAPVVGAPVTGGTTQATGAGTARDAHTAAARRRLTGLRQLRA